MRSDIDYIISLMKEFTKTENDGEISEQGDPEEAGEPAEEEWDER